MESIILLVIIVLCIAFIAICMVKRRPDLIVNVMLRAILGTAGIYLLDMIFKSRGYGIIVGVNVVTILTNGLLGLPGFILLYGLAFYYSLK